MSVNQAVDRFLDAWIQEFGRTIEMFGREQPTVTCSRTRHLPPNTSDDLLWWKQTFDGAGSFTNWIGASEGTWAALGTVSQGAELADAKASYLEMIEQAQHGTATAISVGLPAEFRCSEGQEDGPPPKEGVFYAVVGIKFPSGEVPALMLAVDSGVSRLVPDEAPIQTAKPTSSADDPQTGPMLDRLMELELPLSVALGRTQIPIREVLKVTPGSLIDLDRTVGDLVELIVHGRVVARGEVVSVKGNYGVRIKEIISQKDRMHLYSRD